jgi:hypothetical protein
VPLRFVDALVGGVVALVASQLAAGRDPVAPLVRESGQVFDEFACVLEQVAAALDRQDQTAAPGGPEPGVTRGYRGGAASDGGSGGRGDAVAAGIASRRPHLKVMQRNPRPAWCGCDPAGSAVVIVLVMAPPRGIPAHLRDAEDCDFPRDRDGCSRHGTLTSLPVRSRTRRDQATSNRCSGCLLWPTPVSCPQRRRQLPHCTQTRQVHVGAPGRITCRRG